MQASRQFKSNSSTAGSLVREESSYKKRCFQPFTRATVVHPKLGLCSCGACERELPLTSKVTAIYHELQRRGRIQAKEQR